VSVWFSLITKSALLLFSSVSVVVSHLPSKSTHTRTHATPQLVIIESAGVPVGPSGGEVALLLTVDFLLDRILTAVNVMGDSIGAGICQHYKEKDAAKDGSGGGDDSYVPPGSADYSQMDVSGAGSGNL
jgi:Na+/H+-dicarboxylate symporter